MREEVERFEAIGDSGQRYTVVVWAKMVPHRPLDGPVQWLRGGLTMELIDGRHVNPKNAGTFEIFDTEETIRKV
ncbi:hypothetical protein [Rhizorhabdus histidinilytica]|uniref:hypothetical protein n=1 Tax=Rhizorhabdus histidinilytica TaxID=439228 RepID=UPI00321FEA3D